MTTPAWFHNFHHFINPTDQITSADSVAVQNGLNVGVVNDVVAGQGVATAADFAPHSDVHLSHALDNAPTQDVGNTIAAGSVVNGPTEVLTGVDAGPAPYFADGADRIDSIADVAVTNLADFQIGNQVSAQQVSQANVAVGEGGELNAFGALDLEGAQTVDNGVANGSFQNGPTTVDATVDASGGGGFFGGGDTVSLGVDVDVSNAMNVAVQNAVGASQATTLDVKVADGGSLTAKTGLDLAPEQTIQNDVLSGEFQNGPTTINAGVDASGVTFFDGGDDVSSLADIDVANVMNIGVQNSVTGVQNTAVSLTVGEGADVDIIGALDAAPSQSITNDVGSGFFQNGETTIDTADVA